ncbi:hypothetical protein BKA93DRAFT_829936 [Sparassis latifolia]
MGSEGLSKAASLSTLSRSVITGPSEDMLALPERVIVDQSKLGYKEASETKGVFPWQVVQSERRNALSEEVGMKMWFEDNGIPYNTQPTMKGSGYLTASNVSQSQLEQVYNWKFYSNYIGDSSQRISQLVTDHIERLLIVRASSARSGIIKIPKEWCTDTNVEVNEASPSQILRKALRLYIEYANEEHINNEMPLPPPFDLTGDQSSSAEPVLVTLDLSLYDSHNAHSSRALSMEWTILKLLAFPGTQDSISEMDVERHIGSILTGLFNIRGCTRYSSTALKYPTAFACFGSYPRPDAACQISGKELPTIKFCRPLVLAGEAKRRPSPVLQEVAPSGSAIPSDESPVRLPRPASQLAWAFQPTLELFIVDLVTKYRNPDGKTWKKEWNPLAKAKAAIPGQMVVFGIIYDKNGIVIYSYAPTYKVSNGKVNWGFECRQVSTEHEHCFNGEYSVYKRALLLRALLAIVSWSDQLAAKWAHDLTLPPIIAELDEKWGSVAF